MNDQDPIDDLLRSAFAADLERTPSVAVSERVMTRIHRSRRLRLIVLGGAALAGATVVAALAQPALGALDETVRHLASAEWPGQDMAVALLGVLGFGWLMLLDNESV